MGSDPGRAPEPAEAGPAASVTRAPNRVVGGAFQRVGGFWIEEPRWFWALWAAVLLLAVAVLALALMGDPP